MSTPKAAGVRARCPSEGRRCPVRCPLRGHPRTVGVRMAVRPDAQRPHPPWLVGLRQCRSLPARTPPQHRLAGCPATAAVTPRAGRASIAVSALPAPRPHTCRHANRTSDGWAARPSGLSVLHLHQGVAQRAGRRAFPPACCNDHATAWWTGSARSSRGSRACWAVPRHRRRGRFSPCPGSPIKPRARWCRPAQELGCTPAGAFRSRTERIAHTSPTPTSRKAESVSVFQVMLPMADSAMSRRSPG